MQWHVLLLLPISLVTFFTPQAQSLPGPVFETSTTTPVVIASTTTVAKVNPDPGAGTREVATSTGNVTLRKALVPVCACESQGDPFKTPTHWDIDGQVLRGRINPQDIGMCQIHAPIWEPVAIKLGFNIYEEQGNIKMANHIYDTQGLAPWKWSEHCWSRASTSTSP